VHAHLSSASDLIPVQISENCGDEGLLKFPHRFRIGVPLRYICRASFSSCSFTVSPSWGWEKEKAVTLVTL